MAFFDVARLTLGDVVSGKAKTCPAIYDYGEVPVVTLEPMHVRFEPSAYQNPSAERLDIVWSPPAELVKSFGLLDQWIVDTLAEDPVRWFGKERTKEQIAEAYTPIIKWHEKRPPLLKAKINMTTQTGQCRIWDQSNKLRPPPENWAGCLTKPRLKFKGLYFMGSSSFGAVLECMDVQIMAEAEDDACPFE